MLRIWWTVHRETALKLIMLGGSIASMIGLLVVFLPSPSELPWWAICLLAIAATLFILLLLMEWSALKRAHIYAGSDANGIRRYMHNWIQHGGRVAIWTRNMSWAENPETLALLQEKAKREELIICLPQPTDLTTNLANLGAEICAYGDEHLESPASRFTIALLGRDGSRVAIGHAIGESHVINEFDARSNPAFYVAADLVALVRTQQRERPAP